MRTVNKTESVIELAREAKRASGILAQLSTAKKNHLLEVIAQKLQLHQAEILRANQQDIENVRPQVESGEMSDAMFRRLKLDETKLAEIIEGVKQVAALADPVGKITLATKLDEGLNLYRVNCPIGVLGVIFESRPDALVQIAVLAFKSGNSLLLKGGSEAEHSNRILFNTIQKAIAEAGLPAECLFLLESREDVRTLLKAEGFVDLIIPRGSNSLVKYIQENTNIPVLGHAEGICHVYIDRAADMQKALRITIDAKTQYASVCNAAETLLIHRDIAREFLPTVIPALQQKNVEIRCAAKDILEFALENVEEASEEDWRTEYNDLILSIKTVASIDEAIAHINRYGSRHTDAIITEDPSTFEKFFAEVDSAGVFLNASTRFADGFRYGFGAEVGISTHKLHPRGPVGLDGLVTYKYKLIGDGHIVADYSGKDAKPFLHTPLKID
ncbi:MAG: glutamate-5-semialdehyde dehydrogenase [Acidobacteriota bacterium]